MKKSSFPLSSVMPITVIILFSLLCFSLLSIQGHSKEKEPYWRFDSIKSCQDLKDLYNYRICTKSVRLSKKEQNKEKDYKKLLISGSGQLPSDSYDLLINEIKKQAPEDCPIYMVDLRQESHGYLNDYSVSLHGKEHNNINRGLLTVQVIAKEALDLKSLYKEKTLIQSGNKSVTKLEPMIICPDKIETEKKLAEQAGFIYIRFAGLDHNFPQEETVDEFISFYRQLPEQAWLHFHCLAGKGRTSVFMIMYDLMKNPDLSLERAANRQYMIGGRRIVASSAKDEWSGKFSDTKRTKSLILFSKYVKANYKNNYETPYSQWLKNLD